MDEIENSEVTGTADVAPESAAVTVDCARCLFRESHCARCVVSVVVAGSRPLRWNREEVRAIGLLADAGMVPPLRHAA
ncbi:hypothetical protein FFT09_17225 [Saccharomonospora piscinae]|uniref:hypothetical protein n=1 Tax=Saccharomonospora piscinae TaxID=687388 RepID=UPI001106B456|nr:hypothetical protein [Saccharomonospora piscinae]TLW91018.1 hypothetical protein FFT09_17225 [Saccharomonospora piscinae]